MNIRLAPPFRDGMVLQRNHPIRVYGEVMKPLELTVTFDGTVVSRRLQPGPFAIMLPPHRAATGLTMHLTAGEERLTIHNVACGEVWLAGGQSNMAMSLSATAEQERECLTPCDEIRFFTVGRNALEQREAYGDGFAWAYSDDSGWLPCDATSAPHFSAVGYHFAQRLYAALKVPIGIISCNVGGSRMLSWLPQQAILGNSAIAALAELPPDDRPETELLAEYQAYLTGWSEGRQSLENTAGTATEMPCVYYEWSNRYTYKRPSCLYTGMLQKVSRYTVQGILWYQGESEAMDGYAHVYTTTLETLVDTLRREQEEPELPFLLVQLAPWLCQDVQDWEWVCDQQRRFSLQHSGCAMVTIGDLGGEDIHPVTKRSVGERLALAALNRAYGGCGEYSGPIAVEARQWGDRLLIRFTHCEGLCAPCRAPRFTIRYADGSAKAVDGIIEEDTVYLPCDPSRAAAFVEYEYRIDAAIGLYNAQGFPASLFRLAVNGGYNT